MENGTSVLSVDRVVAFILGFTNEIHILSAKLGRKRRISIDRWVKVYRPLESMQFPWGRTYQEEDRARGNSFKRVASNYPVR